MSVTKKLMQARIRLQGIELKKTGLNKFSNYKYFELEDFLPTVQNIFNDIGLCGVVSFTADQAVLTIIDVEPDGGVLEVTSPMASANLKAATDIQNLGAVHTYMRRYLWVTAMEIVEHDSLDAVKPNIDIESISSNMNNATSVEELTKVYTEAIGGIKDKETLAVLKQLATKKKGELNGRK